MKMLFYSSVFLVLVHVTVELPNPKIAIIGAGIGGTSCAYFLRKAFEGNASITVLERNVVGGRLATLSINGFNYEAGGTIIHPKNKYMADFTELLGLKEKEPSDGLWGIYNGEKFVFKDSSWWTITISKLFWRYGWDMFRLNSFVSALLDDFVKIYKLQDQGKAFATVPALLQELSPKFPNMTQQLLKSFMIKNGFSELFLDELVQAVTLVNYGQSTSINAFVGSVSLAGSESGLWNIEGGNNQVPSGLLTMSNAKLVNAEVSSITLLNDNDYEIGYRQADHNLIEREKFDIVVLAAPLMDGHTMLRFDNFSKSFDKYFQAYHRTVATFVQGKLKPSAFNSEEIPDTVLINNDSFMLNSIGPSTPISGETTDPKVYKIFSKLPLTQEQINFLFDDVKVVKVKDWMAYPHYSPPESIPPFELNPDLYYTNAIEEAASAMEMSAISARNVALLIHNKWKNQINAEDSPERTLKDEL